MSPSPDTQDSNSSDSVVMTSSGTAQQQHLAHQKDAAAIATAGGMMVVGEATIENPYLAGLGKKTRGLKKKMDKIKRTEALSTSGKVCLPLDGTKVFDLHDTAAAGEDTPVQ